ncbi:MAG: LysR family transcriptional regulator [Pseudomonadota bacterium]
MTDWQEIRWFHAVLRNGSFSAAARAEGTTQATISRRISALESRLGAKLFDRGLEGAEPTKLAKALAPAALAMADGAGAWAEALRQAQASRRTIILTCGELIGGFLSRHLSRLQDGLDGIDLELRPTNAFVDLTKGEADLALRNQRPERGALKARKHTSRNYGSFSVFGAREHFEGMAFVTLEQLKGQDWIAHVPSMAHLPSAKWIAEHVGEENIRFRMNSTALILAATHNNRALALLPRFIGLEESHLVEVFGPVEDLHFDMWIVRRDEPLEDPAMDRLISNIEAVFA